MRNRIILATVSLLIVVFLYVKPEVFFKDRISTQKNISTLTIPTYNGNRNVVYSKTSKFGLIDVIVRGEPGMFDVCENKNYNLSHSTFSNTDNTLLIDEYEILTTASFLFNNSIKDVLLLGLGGGGFLGYLDNYWPNMTVDAVEINPAIMSVVREFRKLTPKNTKFICDDAFKYIANTDKKYDLIISDVYFFKPNLLDDYKDFFRRVKKKLNKGGIFVMNAFIPYIPKLVIKDLFANFENVAALVTTAGYNVVFICYTEDYKTSIETMDELMVEAKEMQDKYQFRYSLTELVSKVVHITKEHTIEWINKFPDLK